MGNIFQGLPRRLHTSWITTHLKSVFAENPEAGKPERRVKETPCPSPETRRNRSGRRSCWRTSKTWKGTTAVQFAARDWAVKLNDGPGNAGGEANTHGSDEERLVKRRDGGVTKPNRAYTHVKTCSHLLHSAMTRKTQSQKEEERCKRDEHFATGQLDRSEDCNKFHAILYD